MSKRRVAAQTKPTSRIDKGDAANGRATSSVWLHWSALIVVFGVALLLRSTIASIPLERDEGEYAYIGQRWLAGEVPYQETFDQKPPAVFLLYALCMRSLGTSPAAIHWFAQIYTLGTIACVFFIGKRLFSLAAGVAAAFFCSLLSISPHVLGQSANTEVFMILPMTAAFLAVLKAAEQSSIGWSALAGVLSAAALLCKQVAVWNLIFCGLFLLAAGGSRRWRLAAGMVVGSVLALAPTLGYFWAMGAWDAFYDCVIGTNLKYAQNLSLSDYYLNFAGRFTAILSAAWPIYLLAGCRLAYGLGETIFRRTFQEHRADCIVAGWLLCSFAGVATGGYFRPHYFIQIIPAVAILAGEAATGSLLVERITGFRRPVQLFALCSIALIVALAADPWYYRPGSPEAKCRELYFDQPFAVAAEVGHYLRDNSKASDTVFVLGSEPQFLYFAERKSATRYIFTYPLFSPDGETPALQQRVLDEVRASQPEFVVTVFLVHSLMMSGEHGHLGMLEDARKIVQASYHVVAAVPNEEDRLVSGPEVSQLYARAPFWYDRPMAAWWARVLIWQRKHRD